MFNFIENPFVLMKVQGFSCQKVCGAQETSVAVAAGPATPQPFAPDSGINGNVKPAGVVTRADIELHLCHYQKMDNGLYMTL